MKDTELTMLARHSNNGACNVGALIQSLAEATKGMTQIEIRDSNKVKIVVGQISFLLSESLGPRTETIEAYWKETGDIKI